MDKRYQVFISSTYTDLKEERKEVIESLLNAKYIPAGMEMFSASNDEQFKYITKIIDNSDYYVLIVGGRYGSINPSTQKSYTEQEYEYALKKNIPILTFVFDDIHKLDIDKKDVDLKLINTFRERVIRANKLCKIWNTRGELVGAVINSLNEECEENPRQGWIRGDYQDNTELLNQLNNLRIERDKLLNENNRLNEFIAEENSLKDIAGGLDKYLIKGEENTFSGKGSARRSYTYNRQLLLSWDEIFSCIAPYLISAINYSDFEVKLKASINAVYGEKCYFSNLNKDCIQTIKIQFMALGLIVAKPAKSTGGSIIEFINLSEKGEQYLLKLKALKSSIG